VTSGIWSLGLALLGGLALGLLHFGGLWLTVRYLHTVRQPWLYIIGSTVGRLAITLVGFYLIMSSGWAHLLACVGGFLGGRFFLMQRWHATRTALLVPGEGLHGHHTD
jgi:F1F0 ATPase subunit 2